MKMKEFQHIVVSQDISKDFPDMVLEIDLMTIAGILLIPLSSAETDFIGFFRNAQIRQVKWAGKPAKEDTAQRGVLEPRKSFEAWSEMVVGTSRAWRDEEQETASVLSLIYGKSISVWRQREQAKQHNHLHELLLANATHEVRTPLNHIINYLELALENPLDPDTRDNLDKSRLASKSLPFIINDLLDLTRIEDGNDLLMQEPFDIATTIRESVAMHKEQAERKNVNFSTQNLPHTCFVVGDSAKVRQILINTVSNSVKYTQVGSIWVEMKIVAQSEAFHQLADDYDQEAELVIGDRGSGTPQEKLRAIFREFEQVKTNETDQSGQSKDLITQEMDLFASVDTKNYENKDNEDQVVGLGLAIVARVVKTMGGQTRVYSTVGRGSHFVYYLPFKIVSEEGSNTIHSGTLKRSSSHSSGGSSNSSVKSAIDSLVDAFAAPQLDQRRSTSFKSNSHQLEGKSDSATRVSGVTQFFNTSITTTAELQQNQKGVDVGGIVMPSSKAPLRSVKVDADYFDAVHQKSSPIQGQQKVKGSAILITKKSIESNSAVMYAYWWWKMIRSIATY